MNYLQQFPTTDVRLTGLYFPGFLLRLNQQRNNWSFSSPLYARLWQEKKQIFSRPLESPLASLNKLGQIPTGAGDLSNSMFLKSLTAALFNLKPQHMCPSILVFSTLISPSSTSFSLVNTDAERTRLTIPLHPLSLIRPTVSLHPSCFLTYV